MISNNPTNQTTGNSKLSKLWKNHNVFQGLVARVLFQILLLVSIIMPLHAVEANPLITNTATANYTINGNNLNLSDSVQFTKDTVVVPPDVITLQKQTDSSTATVDDLVKYTLLVTNPNSGTLSNVTIEDTLPAGLFYQSGTAKLKM